MEGISVICTGTELLKGSTANTNLLYLGAELTAAGVPLNFEMSVGDHADELYQALGSALKFTDIIIVSGGLGPTLDDITLETVARFFGKKLIPSPELKAKVEEFWQRVHPNAPYCPKMQYKQAVVPEGGEIIPNPIGSASGLTFCSNYGGRKRRIIVAPGPPREFEPMVKNYIKKIAVDEIGIVSHTVGFFAAAGESTVARIIEPLLTSHPVEIAYTAVPGGTKVFLSGVDKCLVNVAVKSARQALGELAFPSGKLDLSAYILERLGNYNLTVGCAESCTGGMIAQLFTAIPGASCCFKGGIIAYDNEVKITLLGVKHELIADHGAVSPLVAEAMAVGVAQRLQCSAAISTTGIAGPGGGTQEKPVGLVYIGATLNGLTKVKELHLRGGRRAIREQAVAGAMLLLNQLLNEVYPC